MSYQVEIMHTYYSGTIVSFKDALDVEHNFRGHEYRKPSADNLKRLARAIKQSCHTWIEFDEDMPIIKSRINHCPTCGDGDFTPDIQAIDVPDCVIVDSYEVPEYVFESHPKAQP